MFQKVLSTFLVIFCLFLSIPIEVKGQTTPKSVVLVLVNHLSLEDIRQMEKLSSGEWLKTGTVGAMNLRTAGKINDVNNVVTIGSGVRSVGTVAATEAYMAAGRKGGITAGEWYSQLTGREMPKEAILVPNFNSVWKSNQDLSFTVIPGQIGGGLHQHGLKTAAIGNSDTGENEVRFAPLLAMDEYGVVDGGDISSKTTRKASDRVYGKATNYPYILKKIEENQQASFITIELGDLYRLASVKDLMNGQQYQMMKTAALTEINQFMTTLISRQDKSQMILLLAPMVPAEAEANKSMMAPFIQITPEHEQGVLYTSTTRQPGIVANVDVAPTVLQWLEIPVPDHIMGRPIATVKGKADFWKEWEVIKHIYSTRSDVLVGYVSFQIVILILATAFWYFGRTTHPYYKAGNHLLRFLLLMIVLSPFLFLILPLFPTIHDVGLTIFVLLLLGTGLSAAVIRLPYPWIFLIVSLVNWFPVLIDGVVWNSMLMKRSYLGYDPIIGARYYGIGNEYMGVVIGSSILSLAMLLEITKQRQRWLTGLSMGVFGLYLLFFALPRWGTNAGGAITAVAAYLTSFVRLFDIHMNRRYLFWGGLAVFITLGSLFLANMLGDDQVQSHIGRAMNKLVQGDLMEIGNIIERKLAMNWKLIGVSSWSKVFITSILLLGFICYRPFGMIGDLNKKFPYVIRGFFGIIIGAFTGLVVNDSGIVAAATTIIYMIVPMLFLGLEERLEQV